jgi:hypothetical protein
VSSPAIFILASRAAARQYARRARRLRHDVVLRAEIRRIAEIGFQTALKRGKKLCSVDKENVLETSRFWREIVNDVAKKYPQVALSHMYVDNAAMQLVRDAEAVRRHRYRQYVRRYSVGRGLDADRFDRHAAVGFARFAEQGVV